MSQRDGDKDILEVLSDLDNGRAVGKISRELTNIAAACNERQTSGHLTIKLNVVPSGPGGCRIVPAITTKRPGPPLEAQSYDVSEEGDLRTQLNLPAMDLDSPPRGRRRSPGQA